MAGGCQLNSVFSSNLHTCSGLSSCLGGGLPQCRSTHAAPKDTPHTGCITLIKTQRILILLAQPLVYLHRFSQAALLKIITPTDYNEGNPLKYQSHQTSRSQCRRQWTQLILALFSVQQTPWLFGTETATQTCCTKQGGLSGSKPRPLGKQPQLPCVSVCVFLLLHLSTTMTTADKKLSLAARRNQPTNGPNGGAFKGGNRKAKRTHDGLCRRERLQIFRLRQLGYQVLWVHVHLKSRDRDVINKIATRWHNQRRRIKSCYLQL